MILIKWQVKTKMTQHFSKATTLIQRRWISGTNFLKGNASFTAALKASKYVHP
jgi:hypothetical protein